MLNSRRFQQGEGPSGGLLGDCENPLIVCSSYQNLTSNQSGCCLSDNASTWSYFWQLGFDPGLDWTLLDTLSMRYWQPPLSSNHGIYLRDESFLNVLLPVCCELVKQDLDVLVTVTHCHCDMSRPQDDHHPTLYTSLYYHCVRSPVLYRDCEDGRRQKMCVLLVGKHGTECFNCNFKCFFWLKSP